MVLSDKAGRTKRWAALVTTVGVGAAAACLLLFINLRNTALQDITDSAQQAFGGGPVVALMAQASSTEATLAERNDAVWALGEIRDRRALPTLKKLHVQEDCDHARLVCQREVKKAIRKINGEMSPVHSFRSGLKKLREWLGES